MATTQQPSRPKRTRTVATFYWTLAQLKAPEGIGFEDLSALDQPGERRTLTLFIDQELRLHLEQVYAETHWNYDQEAVVAIQQAQRSHALSRTVYARLTDEEYESFRSPHPPYMPHRMYWDFDRRARSAADLPPIETATTPESATLRGFLLSADADLHLQSLVRSLGRSREDIARAIILKGEKLQTSS